MGGDGDWERRELGDVLFATLSTTATVTIGSCQLRFHLTAGHEPNTAASLIIIDVPLKAAP